MYIPKWYREDSLPVLFEAIEKIGFGTLVTLSNSHQLVASHIPMLIDGSSGEKGTIFGHIARGNSQWRDFDKDTEALAMFVGPQAYISPLWYETTKRTGEVVPTWDYIAVHVYGRVSFFEDSSRLLDLVTRLTNHHEAEFSKPWRVSDAPKKYIDSELKSIVGFEMPISKIEGKWKMSQNRPLDDREGAIRGLRESSSESASEVADEIEKKSGRSGQVSKRD